jgi:hypothetical protein
MGEPSYDAARNRVIAPRSARVGDSRCASITIASCQWRTQHDSRPGEREGPQSTHAGRHARDRS